MRWRSPHPSPLQQVGEGTAHSPEDQTAIWENEQPDEGSCFVGVNTEVENSARRGKQRTKPDEHLFIS
jgi:hypothetical protein